MTIKICDISKEYGDQLVVNHVSLEVREAELFVLLGASGSGKSTVLRVIAGLVKPEQGRVELNGRDVTSLPPQAREVGIVFQNYAVFGHMSVAQNVEFGLKIRGIPASIRVKRREELLELVGLGGLGERRPNELSGGQKQRVALARALAYRPSVLLLDEPFGALDAKIRSQLRRSLSDIQRELKVTTILVTHDQEEAFELGDRIGVLERGRLVEIGTPGQLYHHPRTEAVATFIGGGNVLVGRAEKGKIRLGTNLLGYPAGSSPQEEGAPVRILFRPETVHLSQQPFGGPDNIVTIGQGRLIQKVFGGSDERLRFELETLQGTRPLEPALAYGQRFANIEAVRATEPRQPERYPALGNSCWIGLSHFHVLAPSGLKVLACVQSSDRDNLALKLARELGQASHGPLTALNFAEKGESVEQSRDRLSRLCVELLKGADFRLEAKSRGGSIERELSREAQEGFYDLVILAQPSSEEQLKAIEYVRKRLLHSVGVPVLLTAGPVGELKRVLICTAAGEPGKSDVRIGARLARHTRSFTTVFHVLPEEADPEHRKYVEKHLQQASLLLSAYNVQSEVKLAQGLASEKILAEASQGGYDLVIIGASARSSGFKPGGSDLAARILVSAAKAVLIVPPLE
jgi:sulfate/thiosulfate transport system ATP-binding protein